MSKKNAKGKSSIILKWLISVFMLIGSLVYWFSFASVVFALLGIALLPISPIQNILNKVLPKIPYLGVWLNSGGFKDMYNLALEPCTSPFDTPVRASERNCGSVLESSEMQQFSIKIIVE